MGGSSSKPAEFKPDYSQATFRGDYVQEQLKKATSEVAAASATAGSSTKWMYVLLIIASVLGLILAYDYVAVNLIPSLPDIGIFTKKTSSGGGATPDRSNILYISSASYGEPDSRGNLTNSKDVTKALNDKVTGDTTLPSFVVSYSTLGFDKDPYPSKTKNMLVVKYYVGLGDEKTVTAYDGDMFPQLPEAGSGPVKGVAKSEPSVLSRAYNAIFGDSSGDLAPSFHDATTSAIVSGKNAPLSSENQGGYGMQWWMYVKDWNYGYGKQKSIVKRGDSTNGGIVNPHVSLHPTDNALQVTVSVFPATEGGSGKAEPAPAGHSGATDDVFTCDVPNIPLQTWFSVAVTVFGRNMDIYIDGKLVKSCFLTGVPKPTVGDIQLTPSGGFSGRICGFYHYPRMLTPADALNFWSAGTSCRSRTEPSTASKATGYSVKFGVYDVTGKEVQEYAF